MADPNLTKIQFKRSITTGSIPTASSLSAGELVMNVADARLWSSDGTNLIEFGLAKGGSINGSLTVAGNLTSSTGYLYSNDSSHYIYLGKNGDNNAIWGDYYGRYNFYNTSSNKTEIAFNAGSISAIGNLVLSSDNTGLTVGNNTDIGIIKTSGSGGKIVVGSGTAFIVAKSSTSTVTFTDSSTTNLLYINSAGNMQTYGNYSTSGSISSSSLTASGNISSASSTTSGLTVNGGILQTNTSSTWNTIQGVYTGGSAGTNRQVNGIRFIGNSDIRVDIYEYENIGTDHGLNFHVYGGGADGYFVFNNGGKFSASAGLSAGPANYGIDGDINGTAWNGYLSNFIKNSIFSGAGNIGSYAFACTNSKINLAYGDTIAGSSLFAVGISASLNTIDNVAGLQTGITLSGTWLCLGNMNERYYTGTLFQRIA